jgi:hypothetical protein
MGGTEKLLEEIKVWETEVISEELSGNIVKLAYAKGRLNGLQIVYAFEQAKIAKLEGWLKYLHVDIKFCGNLVIDKEISDYIKAMEGKSWNKN